MAGPLSGIAGGSQVPLSQPSSLNQNQNDVQVRQQEDEQAQPDQVQPQSAPAAETQGSSTQNTNDQNILQQQIEELLSSDSAADAPRGSLVDIAV